MAAPAALLLGRLVRRPLDARRAAMPASWSWPTWWSICKWSCSSRRKTARSTGGWRSSACCKWWWPPGSARGRCSASCWSSTCWSGLSALALLFLYSQWSRYQRAAGAAAACAGRAAAGRCWPTDPPSPASAVGSSRAGIVGELFLRLGMLGLGTAGPDRGDLLHRAAAGPFGLRGALQPPRPSSASTTPSPWANWAKILESREEVMRVQLDDYRSRRLLSCPSADLSPRRGPHPLRPRQVDQPRPRARAKTRATGLVAAGPAWPGRAMGAAADHRRAAGSRRVVLHLALVDDPGGWDSPLFYDELRGRLLRQTRDARRAVPLPVAHHGLCRRPVAVARCRATIRGSASTTAPRTWPRCCKFPACRTWRRWPGNGSLPADSAPTIASASPACWKQQLATRAGFNIRWKGSPATRASTRSRISWRTIPAGIANTSPPRWR